MNKLTTFLERLYLRLLTRLIGGRTVVTNAEIRGIALGGQKALIINSLFRLPSGMDVEAFLKMPPESIGIVSSNIFKND